MNTRTLSDNPTSNCIVASRMRNKTGIGVASGLLINLDKYVFGSPSIKFFGHNIEDDAISTQPEKIKDIQDFPYTNFNQTNTTLHQNDQCLHKICAEFFSNTSPLNKCSSSKINHFGSGCHMTI